MQLKIQSQYLKQLLRTHSIKIAPPDKPFKLASGGESLVFCDVKQTILQPEGARAAAEMLLERIHDFEQEHEMVIDAVAGVVLGGCARSMHVNFHLAPAETMPFVHKPSSGRGRCPTGLGYEVRSCT